MNKHILLKSISLMILVIMTCFMGMIYADSRSYQDLIEEQVETVVRMSSIEVKNEIENDLREQLTVARDMANNTFLHTWVENEVDHLQDEDYMNQLYQYLKHDQTIHGYTTVFCVSALSGNYYYQDGFNKTLHEGNEHDVWYYNFLDLNQTFDIQVDTDEINDNIPTIFINYRMLNRDGKLLGVVGVAVELTDVQNMINSYEKGYNLKVLLVNRGNAHNSFTQDTQYFISPPDATELLKTFGSDAMTNSEEGKLYWNSTNKIPSCIVDTYSSQLKWNILVEKNTNSLSQVFIKKMMSSIFAVFAILAVCISVTSFIFHRYEAKIVELENMDELTDLPNRKLFEKLYEQFMRKKYCGTRCLFMFDIDHFKNFNDTKGHLFGNVVLTLVGTTIKEEVQDRGIAARWGGDEFIGVVNCDMDEAEAMLQKLMKRLAEEEEPITLSVGLMELNSDSLLPECMGKVDRALYQAKEAGRNRIVRYTIL